MVLAHEPGRKRQVAEASLRLWTLAFTQGDLQIAHVFVDAGEIGPSSDTHAVDQDVDD
jgi:hypothetical protein